VVIMSTLAPESRKLIATTGANLWYPAVTEEELGSDQTLITNYRRSMGHKRVLLSIIGLSAGLMLWSYIRGDE
jgi:hypothetical protein